VSTQDLAGRIQNRLDRAAVPAPTPLAVTLAAYVDLLARWNRKINLTALPLDPPTDAALDRLIVEPVAAARLLGPDDRRVLDVGSGGGSPALPMKIVAPNTRFVLVEVRDRKSAFLREAIRHLDLADTTVLTARLEDLPAPHVPADVITVRAVRVDDDLIQAIRRQLRADGRMLWFRSGGDEETGGVPSGLRVMAEHAVMPDSTSRVFETKMA